MAGVRKIKALRRFWVVGALLFGLGVVLWLIAKSRDVSGDVSVTSSAWETYGAPVPRTPQIEAAVAPQLEVTVAGRVIDALGGLVEGCRITAKSEPNAAASDITEADGQFALTLLFTEAHEEADVVLRAEAEGYLPETRRVLVGKAGVRGLEVVLKGAAGISGRVVDQDRRPVQYVIVRAFNRSSEVVSTTAYQQSPITSPDGTFSITGLADADYALTAEYYPRPIHSKWRTGIQIGTFYDPLETVHLSPGEQRTNLELVLPLGSATAIEGIVCDEQGRPVQQARLWASPAWAAKKPYGLAAKATDAAGRFAIVVRSSLGIDETPAVLDVYCEHEDYEQACVKGVAVGTTGLRVILEPVRRGKIVGTVCDAKTRKPINDAKVLLSHVETGRSGRHAEPREDIKRRIRQDEGSVNWRGRFKIEDVRAGLASLLVFAPGYGMTVKDDIEVLENRATDVEILLTSPGLLRIEFVFTGLLSGQDAATEGGFFCALADPQEDWSLLEPDLQSAFLGETGSATVTGSISPGVHEMTLQPGLYNVTVFTRTYVTDTPVAASWNGRTLQAQVESGGDTSLLFELGGAGIIEGTVGLREGEDSLYLVLTPSHSDSAVLSEITDPSDWTQQLRILAAYGEAQFAYPCPEAYQFTCAPEGTYTVTVFSRLRSDDSYHIRDTAPVQVTPDEVSRVDFR